MDLTNLTPWEHDASDLRREERKRWHSPSSFFFSQGQALVLAAEYFVDSRLTKKARGGVAQKHRHRIHLALFGQLMASLEYLFKDFVAQVVDMTEIYDERIKRAKWIEVNAGQILNIRTARTSPGALLLHSTLGWHDPRTVNQRYKEIFEFEPIDGAEVDAIERLWVLRHSVAHNAGLVIAQDAARGGMPQLSNQVVDIDAEVIDQAFSFLCNVARRVAEKIGDKVVLDWLRSKREVGKDYRRDKLTYTWLKWLATYVESRTQDLPRIRKGQYSADFVKANPP